MKLQQISTELTKRVNTLTFPATITHIYNPLEYAQKSASVYLKRFAKGRKEALFLGMNPGPFGMAQTGVPFGDVTMVRDWMGIEEPVGKPSVEHPKRPVDGFKCGRNEVSGTRLWGWAKERFGAPEHFFDRFFVWNYCPLVFMTDTGANFTPDKLPAAYKAPLFEACDAALNQLVSTVDPEWVIGVGKFAEDRARAALADHEEIKIGRILHPSPASPAANRGWAEAAEKNLADLGFSI
jgi:single-strand selective monofunctional uracil DNA glycosylase